jgi:predicted RNA-binding protein with PUA-like domain
MLILSSAMNLLSLRPMQYFLLKTEPSSYSIDDLKRDGVTSWGGVRNYQARNVLRSMKLGDQCFIYHSSCDVPAIVGLGHVMEEAYFDPIQFDQKSEYFDPTSPIGNPRWSAVDIGFLMKYDAPLSLTDMKTMTELAHFRLLKPGNRLSVIEVSHDDMRSIVHKL